MKKEYQDYLERMQRFNEWEEQQAKAQPKDTPTKVREHLAMMEFAHQIIPKEKKEQMTKEKIDKAFAVKALYKRYEKY